MTVSSFPFVCNTVPNVKTSGDDIESLLRESEELTRQNEALFLQAAMMKSGTDATTLKKKRGRPPKDKSGANKSPSGRKRKAARKASPRASESESDDATRRE
jgi:hypothetical protein